MDKLFFFTIFFICGWLAVDEFYGNKRISKFATKLFEGA